MTELFSGATSARRTFAGLVAISGVGLAVFTTLERPFVGVGIYAVALVGAISVQWVTEMPVFDERDEAIAGDAARWTLTVLGWTSAGVFPALTVAWGLGAFEWRPWSAAIAVFVASLYAVYGLFVIALQRRR